MRSIHPPGFHHIHILNKSSIMKFNNPTVVHYQCIIFLHFCIGDDDYNHHQCTSHILIFHYSLILEPINQDTIPYRSWSRASPGVSEGHAGSGVSSHELPNGGSHPHWQQVASPLFTSLTSINKNVLMPVTVNWTTRKCMSLWFVVWTFELNYHFYHQLLLKVCL